MIIIKSYTDIEQSKKLAKILPIESADMYWFKDDTETPKIYPKDMMKNSVSVTLPCWSFAVLFSILPKIDNYKVEIRQENNCFCCAYTQKDNNGDLYWHYADNPVDACYEMIIRLHELNLL